MGGWCQLCFPNRGHQCHTLYHRCVSEKWLHYTNHCLRQCLSDNNIRIIGITKFKRRRRHQPATTGFPLMPPRTLRLPWCDVLPGVCKVCSNLARIWGFRDWGLLRMFSDSSEGCGHPSGPPLMAARWRDYVPIHQEMIGRANAILMSMNKTSALQ